MKLIKIVLVSGISLFIAFFILTSISIGKSVNSRCKGIKLNYPGSCSEALIQYISDDRTNISDKRGAIWAAGQLADPKTAESLVGFRSENICNGDRECDYELGKAIKWATTRRNIYSPLWRKLFL